MQTLLITKMGDVLKIVGESTLKNGLSYISKPMVWSRDRYTYVESEEQNILIHESDVHTIDSNINLIRHVKDKIYGFC